VRLRLDVGHVDAAERTEIFAELQLPAMLRRSLDVKLRETAQFDIVGAEQGRNQALARGPADRAGIRSQP